MQISALSIIGFIVGSTCLFLTIFVFSFGRTKLHRVWALFNLCCSIWGFGIFFATKTQNANESLVWWKFGMFGGLFIPVVFYHVACLFCNINRKFLIIFGYITASLHIILLISNVLFNDNLQHVLNSFYFFDGRNPVFVLVTIIWLFYVILSHVELYKTYKQSINIERVRKGLFFYSTLFGFVGGCSAFLVAYGVNIYPYTQIFIAIYVVISTYAILKHKLMNIEVVIRRTLLYPLLVTIITLIYFIIVWLLEYFFRGVIGYHSVALTIGILTIIVLIFQPLKNKIQYIIDKIFFKGTIEEIGKEKEMLESELQRSERLKTVSTLAAGMAHEIKNPLTSIKTFVEYIDKKYQDPEFRAKFKSIVPKEIDKIANIINQLLDYSRAEKISQKECDIHHILDYVLDLYNNVFLNKHIKLQKLYNSRSPNITCDENQIKQAFVNIILNSTEAMPNGGDLIVQTQDINNSLEISIQDNGIGIPKDKIKHLFDPFYTTKEKGTGLGLFIVHQIIQNNKGRIAIDSDINKGTIVKVRFEKPLSSK